MMTPPCSVPQARAILKTFPPQVVTRRPGDVPLEVQLTEEYDPEQEYEIEGIVVELRWPMRQPQASQRTAATRPAPFLFSFLTGRKSLCDSPSPSPLFLYWTAVVLLFPLFQSDDRPLPHVS